MIRAVALFISSALLIGSLHVLAQPRQVRGAVRFTPPSPLVRLTVYPQKIVLDGREARQQLLITGVREDGSLIDVTDRAKYTLQGDSARIGTSGVLMAKSDGQSTLTITVDGVIGRVPVEARNTQAPFAWSFDRHIEAVLTKQGCNKGPCHGAQAGKGGFRLTLRGYDPGLDYERMRLEGRNRRINPSQVDTSLLLAKPSLAMAHVGGHKLKQGTLEYKVIRDWIQAGAPGPLKNEAKLSRLEVSPNTRTLAKGAVQRLAVTAVYSDGHREDVTRWARYASNDENVAVVDEAGRATLKDHGEAAVTVAFLDQVAFSRLTAPFPNQVDPKRIAALPSANFIDKLVLNKLAEMRLKPSARCSDETFIRRVYLDAIGALPTPEEVRSFVTDRGPQKRQQLITKLIERPEFVDFWSYRLSDLLRVNRDLLGPKGMWAFHAWLRECLVEDRPYDQMAREIITASGVGHNFGPANFYRVGGSPEEFSETVSQSFLGIRVQCAHCHNHPFERWTQADYYRMAGFFTRVKKDATSEGEMVSVRGDAEVVHPRIGHALAAAPFGGSEIPAKYSGDRRDYLAQWITTPENPYFSRNFVNRVWQRVMGRGLVEPVDEMRVTNPATNPALLDALAADFAKNGFRIKRLVRTILESNAYQADASPNETNARDDRYYSRYLTRRLAAETLLDAVSQATGSPEKFPGAPLGARAASLPDTRVSSSFLDIFGRPARLITCDCERNMEPNISQALHMLNGKTLNTKIVAKGGVLEQLLASRKPNAEAIEELYARALSRKPTTIELRQVMDALIAAEKAAEAAKRKSKQSAPDPAKVPVNTHVASPAKPDPKAGPVDWQSPRAQVFTDLFWALLSGPEFVFNH